jgi:hypothetical protein
MKPFIGVFHFLEGDANRPSEHEAMNAGMIDLRHSNSANGVPGLSQLSIATGGIFRLLVFGLATGAVEPNGQTIFPFRKQLPHVCYNKETALRRPEEE